MFSLHLYIFLLIEIIIVGWCRHGIFSYVILTSTKKHKQYKVLKAFLTFLHSYNLTILNHFSAQRRNRPCFFFFHTVLSSVPPRLSVMQNFLKEWPTYCPRHFLPNCFQATSFDMSFLAWLVKLNPVEHLTITKHSRLSATCTYLPCFGLKVQV